MPCDKLFVLYLVYNAYVYTPGYILVHPLGLPYWVIWSGHLLVWNCTLLPRMILHLTNNLVKVMNFIDRICSNWIEFYWRIGLRADAPWTSFTVPASSPSAGKRGHKRASVIPQRVARMGRKQQQILRLTRQTRVGRLQITVPTCTRAVPAKKTSRTVEGGLSQ